MAMVGSVDYTNQDIDGEVNMVVAPRQPGSAMKPFTYATALEQGFSPATVLWIPKHISTCKREPTAR